MDCALVSEARDSEYTKLAARSFQDTQLQSFKASQPHSFFRSMAEVGFSLVLLPEAGRFVACNASKHM